MDRCKVRLISLSCRQKFGVDYCETIAPMAKMTIVRTFVSTVASIQQWHLFQMVVSNAFLRGDLDEEVYMTLLLGYAGVGRSMNLELLFQLDISMLVSWKSLFVD